MRVMKIAQEKDSLKTSRKNVEARPSYCNQEKDVTICWCLRDLDPYFLLQEDYFSLLA